MVDVELTRKVRISKEDAARRLIAFGEALAAGDKVQLEDEGNSISFAVAGEVEWKFELEVEDDETELEIELKWSSSPSVEAAPAPELTTAEPTTAEPTVTDKAAAVADEG